MTLPRLTLVDLPWLPRLQPSFKTRLTAVDAQTEWGPQLQALAQQHLGLTQAMALSRKMRQLRGQRKSATLTAFKLGLVSNGTVDFLVPFLEATALRYGIALEVVAGHFGQHVQEALDPASQINAARPDAVLLALDHRGLPLRDASTDVWPSYSADAALAQLRSLREGFRRHGGAVCLVQSLPGVITPQFGSLDMALTGTLRHALASFNTKLAQELGTSGDVMVDVDWLAQSVGLDTWADERGWHMAKMAFAQAALPSYAELVIRTIAAMRGKARKCLVLDLDNTLWGGVIGDDGLEGIALDQGDARGEAHRAIQAAALELRRRGVVLAVCSKNDDATARLPFQSHPGMLIKEEHIAVFVANWEDKASNLERIAKRLDIGLDALVLLDDNPAEREQVRQALPQVAVPELGADASTYLRSLLMAGYFESVAFTPDDLQRAEQYQGNAHRAGLLETSRDLGEFLRSLEMQIRFAPFDLQGRKRITQLINKTNQFNLTTRRYTEAQVAAMESSSAHHTLQINLVDRFGDNGMVCAVICHVAPDEWQIDSWLMSCRVLNRKVEEAVCNRVAAAALAAGAKRLVGLYLPTARNHIVADLYAKLGFTQTLGQGAEQRWELDLARFTPFDVPMADASESGAPDAAVKASA
jgi:FkbH-like protein